MKKRLLSVLLCLVMAVTLLAGCSKSEAPADNKPQTSQEDSGDKAANPVAGKKVAYVMLLPSASIFQMWKDSCANICKALGVEFDFFFCDGDFNKWQDTINTCASAGYDGLLVSHGNQDGSYVFLKEVVDKYPNMKIVTFDTQFYADGEYKKIEGVTQMFQQDDSLVTVLIDDMIAQKAARGESGPARLIKVWRGPNYNSPFDRREVGWKKYEDEGKIVTVGEIQPLVDNADSANSVAAAYLQSVNRADVDGIICYYDAYAQGVYNALLENDNFNGKNGAALPMSSVDIDPVDITNMQTNPAIWTASGTTDWTLNGEIGMRALLLEIAGEYDKIYDPASKKSGVDVIEVPGSAILASQLKSDSTVENLSNVADQTYGNLDYLSETSWMPKALIH